MWSRKKHYSTESNPKHYFQKVKNCIRNESKIMKSWRTFFISKSHSSFLFFLMSIKIRKGDFRLDSKICFGFGANSFHFELRFSGDFIWIVMFINGLFKCPSIHPFWGHKCFSNTFDSYQLNCEVYCRFLEFVCLTSILFSYLLPFFFFLSVEL